MKFNRLSYTIFGSVLLAGALTSCDDFLDTTPDTRVEINTPEQVRLLLVDAYSAGNYATLCEMSSDNIVDNNSPDENGMRYNLTYNNENDLSAFSFDDVKSEMDQDSPSYLWAQHYHAIAVCNEALQAIENLEAAGRGDEVSAQKGEALVSRAYHHFILANVFCMPYAGPVESKKYLGLPYMTEPETKVLVHYQRLPLDEFYNCIEQDFLEGLPLLDDTSYDVPKYHFNTKAANAFAARFYLFTRRYKEAERYATVALGGVVDKDGNIISDGNPQFRTFWQYEFTSGAAMSAAYYSAEQPNNLMLIATNSTYHRSRGPRFAINRDALYATYYSIGPSWLPDDTRYYIHPCYLGNMWLKSSNEYGLYFAKSLEFFEYSDKIAGIGFCHHIRAEFTTEEAVLTRAEARIWLHKENEAIADMNLWDKNRQNNTTKGSQYGPLNRATIDKFYTDFDYKFDRFSSNTPYLRGSGIVKDLHIEDVCPAPDYPYDPSMENLLQCVLHLRRIETMEDGMRWFDIKRYGLEVTHKIGADRVETLTWNDPRRALQIPAEVASSGLEPNIRVSAPQTPDVLVKPETLRVK